MYSIHLECRQKCPEAGPFGVEICVTGRSRGGCEVHTLEYKVQHKGREEEGYCWMSNDEAKKTVSQKG